MTINPDKIWARGFSAIAIAAATVALAGCSLLGQSGGGGTGTDTGDGEGTDTSAFAIKVGDCINDADVSGSVESVPVVDCSEPHDSEAYASIIMDDGDFPGADEVDSQSQDGCLAAFADYVGTDYDSSKFSISYYYPTEDSWANGDREILCTVYVDGEQTTGSAKGSGL
jgi:hypothetical protein